MIAIPEDLKGKALFDYLIKNKKDIIKSKKKAFHKSGAVVNANPYVISTASKTEVQKSDGGIEIQTINEDAEVIRVKVVANTAMWFDHDQDVLMPNCWKKSIMENKHLIPHLHDHVFTLEAKVGEVVDIYSQDIPLVELGIEKEGTTQSLVFVTDIMKSYNPKIFAMYKNNKISQHSIGLMYVNIELAINDEDYDDEYKNWVSNIDNIINKEDAESHGYAWIIREIKLLENSSVLRGSNYLSPTLSNDYKSTDSETGQEPIKPTLESKAACFDTLIKNFNLNL